MEIKIHLPQIQNNINECFLVLDIFFEELKELSMLFSYRLEKKINGRKQEFQELNLPIPSFYMEKLSDIYTDVKLNLYFKCYVFILRQVFDKIFLLIFLLKNPLGFSKVRNGIPNASINFCNFIESLVNKGKKSYDYEEDILAILERYSDLLIIGRQLRNSLKENGRFTILITNDKADIVCPITKKKDKALNFLKKKLSVKVDKVKYFIVEPEFMYDSITQLKDIVSIAKNL